MSGSHSTRDFKIHISMTHTHIQLEQVGYSYIDLGKLPFGQLVDEWHPIYTIKTISPKRAKPELHLCVSKIMEPVSPAKSAAATPRRALIAPGYESGGRIQAGRGSAVVRGTVTGTDRDNNNMVSPIHFPTHDSFSNAVVDPASTSKLDSLPPPFAPSNPDVAHAATVVYPPPGNGISNKTLVWQGEHIRPPARADVNRLPPMQEYNMPPPTPSSPELQLTQRMFASPQGQAQIPTHAVAGAATLMEESPAVLHLPEHVLLTRSESNKSLTCTMPCSLVYISTEHSIP
jgi:hypothetical protein